jgi:cysteinyl-tRNA synthetase
MNITDVGHMSDDTLADGGGEDKMAIASVRLQEAKKAGELPAGSSIDPSDPYAIADFYADAFLEDGQRLGIKVITEAKDDPSLLPRPSRWVAEMISLVEELIAKGNAYVGGDGAVYFSVESFPAYGELSGNTIENLREGQGGRISSEHQSAKRHPADFLLWKPDPAHVMRWESPWGEGYPGWHLECSAMAMGLLAPKSGTIDIHSGGEDNIFPHHECEVAQSCAASGAEAFSRIWFHTRHLIVEGEKMSKSKGNFFTVRDLLEKGATPAAIRLELVRTHYRQNANFTLQGLRDCGRMIDRWCRLRDRLVAGNGPGGDAPGPLERALESFTGALAEDLGIARAIGVLNEALNEYALAPEHGGAHAASELKALEKMDSVLNVLTRNEVLSGGGDQEEAINTLVGERTEAKAAKDWSRADAIRDQLLSEGIAIHDGPDGTTWSRIVE